MSTIGDYLQKADWKKEKHVPTIEINGDVSPGSPVKIQLAVGTEIPHPNTVEHHIRWIKLFFQPEGEKFTVHLATFNLEAHGESAKGSGEGAVTCEPLVETVVKFSRPGSLLALSYCNIHGLWENSQEVKL